METKQHVDMAKSGVRKRVRGSLVVALNLLVDLELSTFKGTKTRKGSRVSYFYILIKAPACTEEEGKGEAECRGANVCPCPHAECMRTTHDVHEHTEFPGVALQERNPVAKVREVP